MRPISLFMCVLALACGCGGEKSPGDEPEKPVSQPDEEPADKVAKTAAPTATDTRSSIPEQPPTNAAADGDEDSASAVPGPIPGVPAITSEPVSPDARKRANQVNREGLELHRKGELEEAIATYKRALIADPSHRFARYNLASVLVTHGDQQSGLALLDEFRSLGCQQCLERLRRARQDGEWKPLWNDKKFLQITDIGGQGPKATVVSYAFNTVGYGEDESVFSAQVILEPGPGWAAAPTLEWHLKVGGKVVEKRKQEPHQIQKQWVSEQFKVPDKPFSIAVLVDGKVFGTIRAKPDDMEPESYPTPLVRPVKHPENIGRCNGTQCPSFPALSPDGRHVASRDDWEVVEVGTLCTPPVLTLTSYYQVPDNSKATVELEPGPSRDLSGWEPLECSGADEVQLQAGFKLEANRADAYIRIVDPAGKEVARGEISGSDHAACVSKKHRLVVVQINTGVGGDCDVVPDMEYVAMRY